jgi:hypothetical protein
MPYGWLSFTTEKIPFTMTSQPRIKYIKITLFVPLRRVREPICVHNRIVQ